MEIRDYNKVIDKIIEILHDDKRKLYEDLSDVDSFAIRQYYEGYFNGADRAIDLLKKAKIDE